MKTAEIITIGTELLLGEIQDTNSRDIALFLRDLGINLYRITTVGDNPERIAAAIQEAMERSDIIITTGGLGPTVDDPTREAVAKAVGVEVTYQDELWDQIVTRFKKFGRKPTENNRKQAYIPEGAVAIKNDVGTAPAFYYEKNEKVIISFPGVPKELSYLLEHFAKSYIKSKQTIPQIIKARILHCAGLGESQVDALIGDLESSQNPTVGLLAKPGQTDIRITAKAENEELANKMIDSISKQIKERLGINVFGEEKETLQQVLIDLINQKNHSFCFLEAGLSEHMISRFQNFPDEQLTIIEKNTNLTPGELKENLVDFMDDRKSDYGLGINLDKKNSKLNLILISPNDIQESHKQFGSSPELLEDWAITNAFDFARRNLLVA